MSSNEEIITEQPRSSSLEVCESSVAIELESKQRSENKSENKLEILKDYESLIIKQELDVIGSTCNCCEKLNKYSIKNCNGKTILTAIEEDNCCNISCCRTGRKFEMRLLDEYGCEVIHLRIPMQCTCCRSTCCCCSQYQNLQVFSSTDQPIGKIRETWNCFRKQLYVYKSSNTDPIYNIDGPICAMSTCCRKDFDFQVENYETGEECGVITKKWTGFTEEVLTVTDNFVLTFPKNADLDEKALLLGASIMIDLMYYENESEKDKEKEKHKDKD